MFENFTNYIISLVSIFKDHQWSLYLSVFLAALIESLPIIGAFIPGTLILLLFGVFAANGFGSLGVIILLSAIGAIIGDTTGYLFGKYGRKFFKEHNRLLKLSHIHSGEVFFAKHGGKSVLFGRFVGPIRPIISLVAGATHTPFGRFFIFNVLGALIWVGVYIILGFIFANNISLIDRIISEISTVALILIVLGSGIYFYFKKRAVIIKD